MLNVEYKISFVWMDPCFPGSSLFEDFIPEIINLSTNSLLCPLPSEHQSKFTDHVTKENFQTKDGSCDHPGDF